MDSLALRVEWQGRGPFWCTRTFRQLRRYCRQATPDWARRIPQCSTFLEHYCAHAASPYDTQALDHWLRADSRCQHLRFGFTDAATLRLALGLDQPLYRDQFRQLLDCRPGFVVRWYAVTNLVPAASDIVFDHRHAVLLEEIRSWAAWQRQ